MRNYKFHIDKPLPEKDEINRHKDFERLYGRYESATRFRFWRSLIRSPKLFASVVLLAVIVWLVFEAGEREKRKGDPLIQPQMELNIPFQQDQSETGQCSYRYLKELSAYFAVGLPLSFEQNGEKYLMQAEAAVQCLTCQEFFPAASDTVYDAEKEWFIWEKETKTWHIYLPGEHKADSSFLLLGKKIKAPAENTKVIRLLDDTGKNLSRKLGKKHRQAFLVLPDLQTLLPIAYDGEGRHILPFVPERALIWAVDADGLWWEVDEAAFEVWRGSDAVDIQANGKNFDAD